MRARSVAAATAMALWSSVAPAFAQRPQPLPTFELDARGFTVFVGQDLTTATDLNIPQSDLATRLWGLAFGGNLYPIRGRSMSIGVGAEGLIGRGTAPVASPAGGQTLFVQTDISSFSGEISANFGHRDGWSYISGGAGPMRIDSFLGNAPLAEPPSKVTVNFGGGARWFAYTHVAIGFDVRFYLSKAFDGSPPLFPGRGKRRIVVVSGGFSIK
jgi:hypothetical protein